MSKYIILQIQCGCNQYTIFMHQHSLRFYMDEMELAMCTLTQSNKNRTKWSK